MRQLVMFQMQFMKEISQVHQMNTVAELVFFPLFYPQNPLTTPQIFLVTIWGALSLRLEATGLNCI